ncbi:hypothetical protein FHR32_000030 [Streptosporangium album]|uniref:Tetracycline repressor TetR C-terminal domain-containing protein n=1 Tax=Streptosporangium album TaxID=47479 RepID=A0A7W7RPD4_9ACTN|nr:TetR/AcrR family transcriptional regulator C-terminal domain-containing protein [Streptosporangium album]MBB4935725.1 hypothetical protein [Streptosporangium album]
MENKEELLDLIYDEVMGEIQVPEPDPERWLEQLRELVMESFRVFSAHADIAKVGLSTIPTGPNGLRIAEAQLAIMLGGGVPPKVAAIMIDRLGLYVCSDTYEGSLYISRQRASGKDLVSFMGEFFGQIETFYRSLPAGRFPNLVGQIDNLMEAGGTERFEFGLDLLLRGLASHVEAGPTTKG